MDQDQKCLDVSEIHDTPVGVITIEQLPDHLIVEIFAYFSSKFILNTLALVNQHWNELAFSPGLWPYLKLWIDDLNSFQLTVSPTLKKIAGGLKTVDLRLWLNDLTEFITTMPPLPHLVELNCFSGQFSAATLSSLALKCPSIENLQINASWNDTMDDAALMVLATEWLCLRRFRFDHGEKNFTQSGVTAFISTARQIDSIDIVDYDLPIETLELLCDKHGSTLNTVHLYGKSIQNAIRTVHNKLPKIQNIFIGDNQMNEHYSIPWDNFVINLEKFKYIRDLHLNYSNPVRPERFAQMFTHFPQLTCASLYCHYIDDASLESLASNCPLLKSLNLNGCVRPTDVGIESIVKGCRNLQFLAIGGFRRKCEILNSVPHTNLPHLKYLYADCEDGSNELYPGVSAATINSLLERTNLLVVNHGGSRLLKSENGVVTEVERSLPLRDLMPTLNTSLKRFCSFTDCLPKMLL